MILSDSDLIDDLTRWKDSYLTDILAKNIAKNTYELYNRVLDNFIEYAREYNEEITIKDIKSHFIQGFLIYLDNNSKKGHLSNSSKLSYLKAVKNLFIHISDNNDEFYSFERIIKNVQIKNTSKKDDTIKYFEPDEVKRVIDYLKVKTSSRKMQDMKMSLLVKLMLYAGLRISEVLPLKVKDITVKNEVTEISIIGKGGYRQNAIAMTNKIINEIEYFENYLKQDDCIFTTRTGKLLSRQGAFDSLTRLYKRAGVNRTGCHILRHTLAMNVYDKTKDLGIVKEVLRHSDIKTTMSYASATKTMVKDGLAQID